MHRAALTMLVLALLLTTTGCVRVKPWERDLLAQRSMGWEPDTLEGKRESHIYFSKEASMPGGAGGGGGCGCN